MARVRLNPAMGMIRRWVRIATSQHGAWRRLGRGPTDASIAGEEGAALAETAIGLCILLTFLLGTFQMALALYTYHFVSDAAREATRYAIVRGSTSCTNTPNLTNCNVTSDQIQTWVRNLGYPGISPDRLSVATTWPTTGANCWPASSPCNNPSNLVNIAVSYSFPINVPFWKTGTINIQSSSQMVISQ